MNLHQFFQALEEMQETAKQLRRAMPTYFSWSEDAVRGTHPVTTTKEHAAGACLEVVRCHLDALLAQYDRARAAIGQPQRFFIYFGYWKAPWDVQRKCVGRATNTRQRTKPLAKAILQKALKRRATGHRRDQMAARAQRGALSFFDEQAYDDRERGSSPKT